MCIRDSISPGRLPIRPANQDVRLPALGDGTMEWTGLNSPTANPLSYNPAQGYLANWNNQDVYKRQAVLTANC